MKSPKEVEAEVRSWGFSHVYIWTDRPNAYYAPHSHAGLTTHVILSGQLEIAYPQDEDADASHAKTKTVHGEGARVDVEAGRVHEVWVGGQGCTYVVGEME